MTVNNNSQKRNSKNRSCFFTRNVFLLQEKSLGKSIKMYWFHRNFSSYIPLLKYGERGINHNQGMWLIFSHYQNNRISAWHGNCTLNPLLVTTMCIVYSAILSHRMTRWQTYHFLLMLQYLRLGSFLCHSQSFWHRTDGCHPLISEQRENKTWLNHGLWLPNTY